MQVRRTKRKAVAPVLATLMMIAVAVAMSVIIFVWSQGFLSQTSTAAGGQQSQQNVAAQSSISIETAIFDSSSGKMTMVIRNVGSVSVNLGSVVIQGVSSNTGFKNADICSSFTANNYVSCTLSSESISASSTSIAKGASATLSYGISGDSSNFQSGDLINVKVSTTAGTFATQQFTVP